MLLDLEGETTSFFSQVTKMGATDTATSEIYLSLPYENMFSLLYEIARKNIILS